jgi:hypothetical protein
MSWSAVRHCVATPSANNAETNSVPRSAATPIPRSIIARVAGGISIAPTRRARCGSRPVTGDRKARRALPYKNAKTIAPMISPSVH